MQTSPLPDLSTPEAALALARSHRDRFYVIAFGLRAWQRRIVQRARSEYAHHKQPADRSFQQRESWRLLQRLFLHSRNDDYCWSLFTSMVRLAESNESEERELRRALRSFLLHERNHPSFAQSNGDYYRLGLERLCTWFDAEIHLTTHAQWQFAPFQFDPDPEKRDLVQTGLMQRYLQNLAPADRDDWKKHFDQLVEKFRDSPKWPELGHAIAYQPERAWRYEKVDTLVINFWPLLQIYSWTYRDLRNVMREALSAAKAPEARMYPLDTDGDLATYCNGVLGLKKGQNGSRSSKGVLPPGADRPWSLRLNG